MPLAVLSIDLVAKLASLEQGFDQAARLAEQNAAKIEGAFGTLKLGAAAIGGVIAGIFAGFSVKEFIVGTNSGVAALDDLSAATGSSVSNLSALENIGARTGNSFEAVASSLVKFNKALDGAKEGDEVSRIIASLNLNLSDLKRIDPSEALRQTAVAFSTFADDGDKARAIQVLFGKSVREAAPFLRDLAEQTTLTGTVTAEAAKQAKEFDDTLHSLAKNSVDNARALVGPIVEVLNTLIVKFSEAREASRSFWSKLREDEAKGDAADAEQSRLARIDALNKLLESGNLTVERRVRLENQLRGLQTGTLNRNENFDGPGETRDRPKPSLKVPDAPKAGGAAAIDGIDSYIKKLNEQTIATLTAGDSVSNLERAEFLLATEPKLFTATEEKRKQFLELAKGLDLLNAKFDQASNAQTKFLLSEAAGQEGTQRDLIARARAVEDLGQSLFNQTPDKQVGAQVQQEIALRKYLDDIGASAEQAAASLNALYGTSPDPTLKAMNEIQLAVAKTADTINGALGQGLHDVLEGKFSDIGKLFKRTLEDMAVQALQANLTEKLFGAATSGGGRAGGGLVDAFLGLFSSGGGKASGGSVRPFSLTRVNENGVEGLSMQGKDYLLTGANGGKVIPAGGSGAAGSTVVVNVASGVSRNELATLIPTLKAQIKAELRVEQRRGNYARA